MREDPEESLDRDKSCTFLFEDDRPMMCIGFKPSILIQMQNAADGQCNWGVLQEEFFPTNVGIALPDETPFLDYFNEMYVFVSL